MTIARVDAACERLRLVGFYNLMACITVPRGGEKTAIAEELEHLADLAEAAASAPPAPEPFRRTW